MIIDRGCDVGNIAPPVAGYAHAAVKDLHCGGSSSYFHLLLGEEVRDAVPVIVELYVIVDVDAAGFPIAVLVTLRRQSAQYRLFQRFEKAATGSPPLAEGPIVQAPQ